MIWLYTLVLSLSYYGLFYCLILKSNNVNINQVVAQKRATLKKYRYYEIAVSTILDFLSKWIILVLYTVVLLTLLFNMKHIIIFIILLLLLFITMICLIGFYNMTFQLIRLKENFKRIKRFNIMGWLTFFIGLSIFITNYFNIDIFSKLNHHHIDDQNFKIFYFCALIVPWLIAGLVQIIAMLINAYIFKALIKNQKWTKKINILWNINFNSDTISIAGQTFGLFLIIPLIFALIKMSPQFSLLNLLIFTPMIVIFYQAIFFTRKLERQQQRVLRAKKHLEKQKAEVE